MEKQLQQLLLKVKEWWNKFNSKQKTIIISIGAGVVLTLAILVTVLSKPQYTELASCESTKEAATIVDLLEGEGIKYRTSTDGLRVDVITNKLSNARLLLGTNNIPSSSYDLENVFSGGFSSTEADKQKRYKAYLEDQMKLDFEAYDFVKNARVRVDLPTDNGTLIAKEEEGFVSIILELDGEMPSDAGNRMAVFAKNAIGNKTANNIVIMDTAGNLLYSGEDNYSVTGNASNQLTVKQQAESIIKNEVKKVLIGTGEFGKIEVASNIVLDFSSSDKTEHLYELPDGQDQGFVVNENTFSSESEGGTNGVPGTDSNTESTYVYQDNNYTSETTTEESKDRVYNEIITQQSIPPGLIKYSDSSIAATLVRYKVVEESSAKNQGLLDGITWDEYKTANGERTKLTIDEDLFQIVSKATGFSLDNISIVAYEEPVFMDKEGMTIKPADIMQIVLIVLIVGLLIFVVFRSMKPSKIEMEEEEELSVESLLQSTPQAEIEDIELESKSETRRMIEKFVDENPEAVASLLRNWLNEEWG